MIPTHCKCTLDIEYPITNNIPKTLKFTERVSMILLSIIKQNKIINVNLWCRGSSGAVIAAFVSQDIIQKSKNINVKICHVKKDGENAHTSSISCFENSLDTWNIIVDDLIASGATITAIISIMNARNIKPDVLCVTGEVCLWKLPYANITYYICGKVFFNEGDDEV